MPIELAGTGRSAMPVVVAAVALLPVALLLAGSAGGRAGAFASPLARSGTIPVHQRRQRSPVSGASRPAGSARPSSRALSGRQPVRDCLARGL